MSTTLHSFIDIFDSTYETEEGHVTLKKICIPIVQRDYAQGRQIPEINRVRKRFLDALYGAVTGTGITLDFVYGDIDENGVMTPLDGQQRLTTLFLLHWYAAKKGKIDREKWEFLKGFSYETRYSARCFCGELVEYVPSFSACLSDEIIDQAWFPLDWKKDPTINSMLVVLDEIDKAFSGVNDLWERLERNSITFYFLPIKDMGLTDELYIKMNSRGKELTPFEHFKAELEQSIYEFDPELAKEVGRKFDKDWSDLLWKYRGDGHDVDEMFLKYFGYICELIFYRDDDTPLGKSMDPLDLTKQLFSSSNSKHRDNIVMLINCFDCWANIEKKMGVDKLFGMFCAREHEEGKILIDNRYEINFFKDCIGNYGVRFGIIRFILLYAFIVYLLNFDSITKEEFSRRIRVINNLANNSVYDISRSDTRSSGNRMPAVIRTVYSVITSGCFPDDEEKAFNSYQTEEEKSKIEYTNNYPDKAEALFRLEDHSLLYGQIGIVGLENDSLFDRFESLFNCNWDRIDCALMTIGDYKQKEKRFQYQLGSSSNDEAWQNLFHKSSAVGFENTKRILIDLLSLRSSFSDDYLEGLAESYINNCKEKCRYDWRYYYIKYDSFRPGRYGKALCDDFTNNPYIVTLLFTKSRVSSNAYNPFIKELDIYRNTSLEDNGKLLDISDQDFCVSIEKGKYILYDYQDIYDKETYEFLDELVINSDGENDYEDRIQKCREWLINEEKVVSKYKLPKCKSIAYPVDLEYSSEYLLDKVAEVLKEEVSNLVIVADYDKIEYSTDNEQGVVML